MMRFIVLFFVAAFLLLVPVYAQDDPDTIFEATVVRIIDESALTVMNRTQKVQELELVATGGSAKGTTITLSNGDVPVANSIYYAPGDKVLVTETVQPDGTRTYYISDMNRKGTIKLLFVLFVALVVVITKIRGALSVAGMAISFLVIFRYILPQITGGADPVNTAIAGSAMIIPVTFILSHGFNRKTGVAIVSTVITLVFTGFLAKYAIDAASLTGFASEEAVFLETVSDRVLNMKGILLAGIIIGVLGILDDVTISQSAVVFQLKKANVHLPFIQLFRRAMDVGHDHISSMVNTLVLVYTGAALPLMLLFLYSHQPYGIVVNHEIIADEIVRTLVGSIGLIVSVPITTALAAFVASYSSIDHSPS